MGPVRSLAPPMVDTLTPNAMEEIALIIGAGPAGLTAAYELLTRTNIRVVIIEREDYLGGLSRTVNYKGNRMDIGGHRFFSKSDRVMKWWQDVMPTETPNDGEPDRLLVPVPGSPLRMLVRQRISRIYYLKKFFDYPVKLNLNTIKNLGLARIGKIGVTYLQAQLFPRKEQDTLESFVINRFGTELYKTFFRDYTAKVWGVPCHEITSDWGAQRIKGLSIASALRHALSRMFSKNRAIEQKNVETSLIERFLYPKFGPGQLWEEVTRRVIERGASLVMNSRVTGFARCADGSFEVTATDGNSNAARTFKANYVFSTMPVNELIAAMGAAAPEPVRAVAQGLRYRDFITVGLLVPRMKIKNETSIPTRNGLIPDNWVYVQENSVKLGRLQLFQNWSPYMVKDLDQVWLGLEYFCNYGDELWQLTDDAMLKFAAAELASIGIIDAGDVLDGTVVRVEKAYPAYFGTYGEFSVIREFIDSIDRLFLIGRNGMHRYNNADHSMLTAMTAVDCIVANDKNKKCIWDVNAEQEYHEKK